MGKMKAAALAETASVEGEGAALVVFGRDEGGRPHASVFAAADVELATRAAAFMGMSVLPITNDEHRAAASELPAGRVFASGKAFVPFTKEAAYGHLESFPEAIQPALPAEAEAPRYDSVPSTWADIGVGGLVLACEAPGSGYFECVVTAAPGDDMFEIRWCGWPDLPPFVRRREHIALMTEAALMPVEGHDAAPEAAAGAPSGEV